MKEIIKNIHLLSLGSVNAYLVDHGELTLIDTGYAGNGKRILDYVQKIGKEPEDLKNIIITHLHTDHTGSLAELKKLTQAKIYMSYEDAKLVERGISFREILEITPGFFNKLIYNIFVKNAPRTVSSVKVDYYLQKNDNHIPIGKGFQIIHVPGHAFGQIALLYEEHNGILFAADTCGNLMGMGVAPFYEDFQQGLKDINKLSKYNFDIIAFGHGTPIIGNASQKFRKSFEKLIYSETANLDL